LARDYNIEWSIGLDFEDQQRSFEIPKGLSDDELKTYIQEKHYESILDEVHATAGLFQEVYVTLDSEIDIHTHPGGFAYPSAADIGSLKEGQASLIIGFNPDNDKINFRPHKITLLHIL
jgi:hypothetical protein